MASKRLIQPLQRLGRHTLKLLMSAIIVWVGSGCSTGIPGGSPSFSSFSGLVSLYRGPMDHLSAVRHGQCPMFPSCSEYAREATEKHGQLAGWMMASDRLVRCGRDELHLAPRIKIDGQWRYYDPVERNDFWWSEDSSRKGFTEAGSLRGDNGRSDDRPLSR